MDDQAKAEAMKRARSIVASLGIKLSRPAQPAPTTTISAPPSSSAAPPSTSSSSTAAAASVLSSNYYEEEEEEEEGGDTSASYLTSDAAAMQDAITSSPASMGLHKPLPPPDSVLDKMHKAQEKLKEKHAAAGTGRSFIDQVGRGGGGGGGREEGEGGEYLLIHFFPPSLPPSLDRTRSPRSSQGPEPGLPPFEDARRTHQEIWL